MKIISKSLLGATAIHGIYFATTFAVGYVKTMTYKPDWEAAWSNVENLPSGVAFNYEPSPFLYAATFLGTTLVCGIILSRYDKFSSNSSETGVSSTFDL